jgi:hypothetical protein
VVVTVLDSRWKHRQEKGRKRKDCSTRFHGMAITLSNGYGLDTATATASLINLMPATQTNLGLHHQKL